MAAFVYALVHYDDGRPSVQSKFIGDQVGVRQFVRGPDGKVEQAAEWRGASIADRIVRTDRGARVHEISFSDWDGPLGFTLEAWTGCHCHHVLKRFRPPTWAPPPPSEDAEVDA